MGACMGACMDGTCSMRHDGAGCFCELRVWHASFILLPAPCFLPCVPRPRSYGVCGAPDGCSSVAARLVLPPLLTRLPLSHHHTPLIVTHTHHHHTHTIITHTHTPSSHTIATPLIIAHTPSPHTPHHFRTSVMSQPHLLPRPSSTNSSCPHAPALRAPMHEQACG